ncbi:MAG: hypothetical protein JSV52_11485 [Candidatus Zixiibacteriota bacterium]|nr:MAG: hypothetical protein JSV52_11485 [candidate division Zixibacteria bacterium]
MPYCPTCGYEYPVNMAVCPDCGEELVDKIPDSFAPAVSPDDSWVLVGGVTSEIKAKVARGSLDSNNIPSVFLPSSLDTRSQPRQMEIDPVLRESGADLILVPKEFGDEAKLVLQAVLGDELIQPAVDNPLI